jgi:hypothetical protein
MDAVRAAQAAHTATRLEQRRQRQLAAASRAAQTAPSAPAAAVRASARLLHVLAAPGRQPDAHAPSSAPAPLPRSVPQAGAAGARPDDDAGGGRLAVAAERLHGVTDVLRAVTANLRRDDASATPERAGQAARAAYAPGTAGGRAGLEQRLELYRAALRG